jgi:hypothetical protein
VSRSFRAAPLALIAVAIATTAEAQSTANASINATATVAGIAPLTAAGVNDLNFGAVTAGTPKSPTSLAADAGRFNISGEPNAAVTITFALPTVLTSGGGATIPVTFGGADGLNWTTYPTVHTTFNPNAAFLTLLNGFGDAVIGISGTVSPPLATTTGTYTGTVTLTVSY